MKICAAQIKSQVGNIQENIIKHKKLIDLAISQSVELIIFPELSLMGYEPKLAREFAISTYDKLNEFQEISNKNSILIGVGMPIKRHEDIYIGMIIFRPHQSVLIYNKQHLHSDELTYFTRGQDEVFLMIGDTKIAPAICYESLLCEHSDKAALNGANIYFASVAKSTTGVEKANTFMPKIAKKHSFVVLMSNSIGPCDNFISAGGTSVWNNQGIVQVQLDDSSEGIAVFDTSTNQAEAHKLIDNNELNQLAPSFKIKNIYQLSSAITDKHKNFILEQVNDHCLRMAVMEAKTYPWHFHPNSEEVFIIIEGKLVIEFENENSILLEPGDIHRVQAGKVHRTIAVERVVNLCVELTDAETTFLPALPTKCDQI